MSDLNALVERIEAGSGEDVDLHAAILTAVIGVNAPDAKRWYGAGRSPLDSLDAAVALVERVLPGRSAEILREALSALGKKHRWHINLQRPGQIDELPRLVVAATLRALSHADHERKE